MKIVVSGASGFLGPPLLARLRRNGHEVVQLVRRDPSGADEARWDPASGYVDPEALDGVQAAINLNGVGVGDRRWSADRQQLIRSSRVESTRTLAAALARLDRKPEVLLNASGIGFYGDRGDEELTESSGRGTTFLADVVQDWESSALAAERAGIRVTYLRSGLVMASHGGAFGRLLPLFRFGVGGRIGGGRQWWSWITLEDQLRAIEYLLHSDLHGPVNLTGPAPARNAEVTAALGRALHRPAVLPVPTVALRAAIGRFAEEITASQRVLPARLLDAGFEFRHGDLDSACAWTARR